MLRTLTLQGLYRRGGGVARPSRVATALPNQYRYPQGKGNERGFSFPPHSCQFVNNVKFQSFSSKSETETETENETDNTKADPVFSYPKKKDIAVNIEKPWLYDLGLRSMIPEWRNMFKSDTILQDVSAGVTIGCVAVPLSLAIAIASEVPPEVGLVTAAVSGVAGGLMGGTTLAITGPAAAISLLVVDAVRTHGLEAVPIITLACGSLQVLSGVTRIGVMAKLVPVSVIAGFTTGVGAMILAGQAPKALGLSAPAGLNPIETMGFISEHLAQINPSSAALAIGTSAAMFFLPKLHPKMPSALLAVGGATLATHGLGLDVALIGSIPSGLEAFTSQMGLPTMPPIESLPSLTASTFLIYAMTSAESLLSCAALEKMKKTSYKHSPDQELVGQGLANVGAGLFMGMPVTSVIARSSLNVKLNAETRLPGLVQAGFVFSGVVFFSSTIATIPMPALSGMLITTGLSMLNPQEFKHCFAIQKLDVVPFVVTIGGMIAFGLAEGIGIGCLSAWALNVDYGKLEVKEMELMRKDVGADVGYVAFVEKPTPPPQPVVTIDVLQTRVTVVETENVQLQGRVLTLQTDNKYLQGRVGTLQTENEHLRERLETVELVNEQLRALFDSLTTSVAVAADGDDADAAGETTKSKSTIGWQLKGPINFSSMFKIDELVHRIEEMKSDEKIIVLDMQETTEVEFTGVEELVARLLEMQDQNPGTTVQMWNCHGALLNALEQCDPKERIARFCSSHEDDEKPFHFPPKEEKPEIEQVPYWYDSPHFRPDSTTNK